MVDMSILMIECSGSVVSRKDIMSEGDECTGENCSCEPYTFRVNAGDKQDHGEGEGQMQQVNVQLHHLEHVNRVWEDHMRREASWTDEMHSLYLNSIEEAFVKNLYDQGYYTPQDERWRADGIESICTKGLNEEVESTAPPENEPSALSKDGQMSAYKLPESLQQDKAACHTGVEEYYCKCSPHSECCRELSALNNPDFHNNHGGLKSHTKRCRSEEICCTGETMQPFLEQDINGKKKKWKSLQKPSEKSNESEDEAIPQNTNGFTHFFNHNHESRIDQAKALKDQGTQGAETSDTQEDQVVPSVAARENIKQ